MKNKYIILFCILLLEFCNKKTDTPHTPSEYWGETSSVKNGMDWTGHPYAVVNINHGNGWNIFFDSLDEFNIRKESFVIYKVPFVSGTYPVGNTPIQINDSLVGAGFYYVDDDVLFGTYKILESDSSSFVTVESYDTLSKEIKGRFDLTFIVDIKPFVDAPDTIRLRNGVFHTKVVKF